MTPLSPVIAIVGLGYVGLPLAFLASRKGYNVIGIDVNKERINRLNDGVLPFADAQLESRIKDAPIEATTDFSRIKEASVVIICVPTPVHEDFTPDLNPVEKACESIAPHIQKGTLIVLESTVNPGVCETVVLPILESQSGKKAGRDFFLAHCPERINPGDPTWNIENINRVVGSLEETGLQKALDFYRSILSAETKPMRSLREAEAVKIVENAFRDINIAFVNELAMSFTRLGIDVVNVIEGAATKPFAFMPHFPGCGVGGHCIPVDPYYLIAYAKKNGFDHDFLSLARRINSKMPEFTVEQTMSALNDKGLPMEGSKIAVLGVAYKPEIDDSRESPSFEIIKELERQGASVTVYDPYVASHSTVGTLDEALEGASAIIIATAHKVFQDIQPEYLLKKKIAAVIDGRNCLPKEKFTPTGIIYRGIGR